MIEPGSQLEKIDLSNAGLYGKNWRIGSFMFRPGAPETSITNFIVDGDDSNIEGFAMSEQRYTKFTFKDIRWDTVRVSDSSDTGYHYEERWVYTIDDEVEESGTSTNIDWHKWGLPALETLIMYGNKINFRYFIGSRDVSVGQAVDRGVLSEDIIKFEPLVQRKSGYLSNSVFESLSDSEKSRIRSQLGNYFVVRINSETGRTELTEANPYLPSSIEDILDDYFTASTFEQIEDISDFIASKEWRNAEFNSTSRNGENEAKFTIRIGSKLWATDGDDEDFGNTQVFAVHRKYKGHAGLGTGLLDKQSTGEFDITGVEGLSGSLRLSKIAAKYGKGVIWVGFDNKNQFIKSGENFDGTSEESVMEGSDGGSISNGSDIRNRLVNFRLYDQTTQSASHHGLALVFPFGW